MRQGVHGGGCALGVAFEDEALVWVRGEGCLDVVDDLNGSGDDWRRAVEGTYVGCA